MKKIAGFVRNIPGGVGVASIGVSIVDEVSGSPVTAGEIGNCSGNPVTTDADGYFEWTADLSPGPVRVEATVGSGQKKVHSGKEVMQTGDVFLSDTREIREVFTDGTLPNIGNGFSLTTTGTRMVILATGAAILTGALLETSQANTLTGTANSTLAERWDLLVLQQYVGGDHVGKQDIVIKAGTVNVTDPALNSDPDVYEVAIWRLKLAMGGSTYTLVDLRVNASVIVNDNTITTSKLASSFLLPVAKGGTNSTTAAAARTALGLAIGTDVQAYDADLAAIAGLASAADKLPYFTGAAAAALADLTSYGRSLIDDANAAAARTTLGLGTLAVLNSPLPVASGGTGGGDAAAARTNLGLGALATLASPLPVANGGTAGTTASAARGNLGLGIGTDVQPYAALLAALVSSGVGFLGDYLFLTSAQDATNYTNASTTVYADAATVSFTLPTGTWTVWVLGMAALHASVTTQTRLVIAVNGSNGVSLFAQNTSGIQTQFTIDSKAGIAAGATTATLRFHPTVAATTTIDSSAIWVLAIRTS